MRRVILALALSAMLTRGASASINPIFSNTTGAVVGGSPGVSRAVHGYITLGASDTYTSGGFTVTPQNLGFGSKITYMELGSPSGAYEVSSVVATTGIATVTITAPLTGSSSVTASATTKVVTVPTNVTLPSNVLIQCTLSDTAPGGGTGTWTTTLAVSTCDYTSATTFTMTATGAAPTGGGNFTYLMPSLGTEINAGTPIASIVIPYVATGI